MEVWSDPPIKSEPYSSGDHAKLCKYVKCGWILQGPGIFKSDPIFRQELTYPGYLEIIYATIGYDVHMPYHELSRNLHSIQDAPSF